MLLTLVPHINGSQVFPSLLGDTFFYENPCPFLFEAFEDLLNLLRGDAFEKLHIGLRKVVRNVGH